MVASTSRGGSATTTSGAASTHGLVVALDLAVEPLRQLGRALGVARREQDRRGTAAMPQALDQKARQPADTDDADRVHGSER